MTINQRRKGGVGEREFAALLRSRGYRDARRGQQFAGANGDADVVGVPGIHLELKRVERLKLYDAVNQARRDGVGSMPVVAHRCNSSGKKLDCRGEWLFVLGADDFFALLAAAGYGPPPITLEDLI